MEPATLETERLILRPFNAGDLDDIVEAINHREVWATTLMIPHPYTLEDARRWVKIAAQGWRSGEAANFAIVPRAGERAGAVSGGIGLSSISTIHRKAELGFWLTPSLWERGLTTEAARAVVRYGFEELELNRIYAGHFQGNDASRRVQEKLGFREEGLLRQDVVKDGRPVDHVMMALLREDFERTAKHDLSAIVPELRTERLVLRAPREADLDAIHEIHAHKSIADGVLSIPHPHTPADAAEWLARMRSGVTSTDPAGRNLIWLICLAGSGQVVGDCGVHWHERHGRGTLGYLIRPDCWNRGLVTEALRAVLDHVFGSMEPPLHRVQADHYPENAASGRVLEKLGFTREGVMRDFLVKNGRLRDVVRWAILREEHLKRRHRQS